MLFKYLFDFFGIKGITIDKSECFLKPCITFTVKADTDEELKMLEEGPFAKFGIPHNVFEASPITIEELSDMGRDCIIIDTTKKVKPIKVTKLN